MNLADADLIGDKVRDRGGADLGRLAEIMLAVDTGRIAYVVLDMGLWSSAPIRSQCRRPGP